MIINTPQRSAVTYDRSDNTAAVGRDDMWRMPSTAYAAGDVRYAPAAGGAYNGLLLTCKTPGTSGSGDLPAITAAMSEVSDGTGGLVWTITRMNRSAAASVTGHTLNLL